MNTFKLNAAYASTFGAYWMIYAVTGSFASVFMLEKGYNNTHIGMMNFVSVAVTACGALIVIFSIGKVEGHR